jgi:hypothetical protein
VVGTIVRRPALTDHLPDRVRHRPAERVNGHRYQEAGLQNLVSSAWLAGERR